MLRLPVAKSWWGRYLGLFALGLVLTGCVNYRLGLVIHWNGSGEISQLMTVEPALALFAQDQLRELELQARQRAKQAGGIFRRTSDGSQLEVVIPFQQPQEIETKLDLFFEPDPKNKAAVPPTGPVAEALKSPKLETRNFWIADYYRLSAALDLTKVMAIPLEPGRLQISGDRLVNLELAITLPWPALSSNATLTQGNTLIWKISTQRINRLEVGFLLPSLPALVVVGIAALGGVLWVLRQQG